MMNPVNRFIYDMTEKTEREGKGDTVRKNEKWRLDYMTLQMKYQEKYEQGIEQRIIYFI